MVEDSGLLVHDAMLMGKELFIFQSVILPLHYRTSSPSRSSFLDCTTLQTKEI